MMAHPLGVLAKAFVVVVGSVKRVACFEFDDARDTTKLSAPVRDADIPVLVTPNSSARTLL